MMPFDFLSFIVAPNDADQHAATWHRDIFCVPPRREPIELRAFNRKTFLPPAVQSFALICADAEHAVARFASGFALFKARANLLTRRHSSPPFKKRSVNLENGPKRTSDEDGNGLHLNAAMVAKAGTQSSPPSARPR